LEALNNPDFGKIPRNFTNSTNFFAIIATPVEYDFDIPNRKKYLSQNLSSRTTIFFILDMVKYGIKQKERGVL